MKRNTLKSLVLVKLIGLVGAAVLSGCATTGQFSAEQPAAEVQVEDIYRGA